jgi:tetratricopeptide (TPR) repeat protein
VSLFDTVEGATLEDLVVVCTGIFLPGMVRQKMNLLSDMHLVQCSQAEHDVEHYTLHPIISEFLREQTRRSPSRLPQLPAIEQAYIQHLMDFVRLYYAQFSQLDRQQQNILHMFNLVLFNDAYSRLRPQAIDALNYCCKYFEQRGLYVIGLRLVSRALEVFEQAPINSLRVQLLHHAGQLAYKQANYQLAREFIQQALAEAQDLEFTPSYGEILHSLGLLQLQQLDYENATVSFEKAEEWASTYGQSSLLFSVWANSGVRAFRESDFDTALRYYLRILDAIDENTTNLPEELQSIVQFAWTALGITYTEIGEYIQAERCYQRSISLARVLNNPERLAYLYMNLGVTNYFLKEYEASNDCFLQGIVLAEHIRHQELITQITWNQGVLASAQEQHSKAIRLLNTALLQAEENNLIRLRPLILVALGKAYLKHHWLRKAQQCFFEAIVSQGIANKYVARALYGLGLRAMIDVSVIGDNNVRTTYQQIERLMQRLCVSPSDLLPIPRSALERAQDYFQHDIDHLPKLSRFCIVEALEMWLSKPT